MFVLALVWQICPFSTFVTWLVVSAWNNYILNKLYLGPCAVYLNWITENQFLSDKNEHETVLILRPIYYLDFNFLIIVFFNYTRPSFSQTFYPRFCLFAVQKNTPEFIFLGLSLAYSRLMEKFGLKIV
jgi:hypothetical protein